MITISPIVRNALSGAFGGALMANAIDRCFNVKDDSEGGNRVTVIMLSVILAYCSVKSGLPFVFSATAIILGSLAFINQKDNVEERCFYRNVVAAAIFGLTLATSSQ